MKPFRTESLPMAFLRNRRAGPAPGIHPAQAEHREASAALQGFQLLLDGLDSQVKE